MHIVSTAGLSLFAGSVSSDVFETRSAAGSFIAEYNAEAVSDLVRLLRDKCQELVRFPNMGRARSELAPGLRSMPAGSYVIFYADADDGVEIVRILAGARDLDAFF
jgi:toxin ParE1/3/4